MLILVSCIKQGTELNKVYCPPIPEPQCVPQIWDSSYIDATQFPDDAYTVVKVKNINTDFNDWQISKAHGEYYLTSDTNGIQKAIQLTKKSINDFEHSNQISFYQNQHFGSLIGYDNSNSIIFASSNTTNKAKVSTTISDGIGYSRLYFGEINGSKISNETLINIQAEVGDWIGQPAIYKDNVIFFSSNMEGGFGANDIWYIIRNSDSTWSKPINCGEYINTACDELSPFIDNNEGIILFASSGHTTIGGYDIFASSITPSSKSSLKADKQNNIFFTKAYNLGSSINTINDELFPFSDSNIDSALYFSSNRQGNNFDIYVLLKRVQQKDKDKIVTVDTSSIAQNDTKNSRIKEIKDITKKEKIHDYTAQVQVKLRGKVLDESKTLMLDSAKIDIKRLASLSLDTTIYTGSNGEFVANLLQGELYRITANKEQYFYDSKDIKVDTNLISNELVFYLPLRGEIRINFPLNEFNNPYQFTLDSNGFETTRKWQDELNLVADNIRYTLHKVDKIILVGHTDYLSSDEYNIYLGEKRVEFVINELIKRGIPKEKLFGRSAGETELLPKRSNEKEENYRKRLRRVTIEKILLK
ncbi:MAG TPA: OmpA family protein [Candidatus Kapabacteria bacterium]|nr:OmpA family protein [Candidatus Kapabacteria bacterium]